LLKGKEEFPAYWQNFFLGVSHLKSNIINTSTEMFKSIIKCRLLKELKIFIVIFKFTYLQKILSIVFCSFIYYTVFYCINNIYNNWGYIYIYYIYYSTTIDLFFIFADDSKATDITNALLFIVVAKDNKLLNTVNKEGC